MLIVKFYEIFGGYESSDTKHEFRASSKFCGEKEDSHCPLLIKYTADSTTQADLS
jgi:hypothetical protein